MFETDIDLIAWILCALIGANVLMEANLDRLRRKARKEYFERNKE